MSKKKQSEGHFGGNAGFKNPPKSGRFKPGQSGNPNGRPKRKVTSVNQAFEEVFMTREKTIVNGKEAYLSGIELFLMKLKDQALRSNRHMDRKIVLDMLQKMNVYERLDDYIDEEQLRTMLWETEE